MSEFEKYEHHGSKNWVQSDLKGKHREHCLCHKCKKLDLNNRETNCPFANLLYAFCCLTNTVTPVYECPEFIYDRPHLPKLED